MAKFVAAILLLIAFGPIGATEIGPSVDPALEAFITKFRLSAQLKDGTQLRALRHAKSKACEDRGDTEYYERVIDGMIRVFGDDQDIESIRYEPTDSAKLARTAASMSKRGISWPMSPDGKIIIRYKKADGARVANLYVGQDEGDWRWLHACKD